MKKILIAVLGIVVVAGVIGMVVAKLLIGYLTPDLLVQEIESRFNCRAEVKSVKASLFGESNVRIEGLRMGPAGQAENEKIAPSKRLPMEKGDVVVQLAKVKVKPIDLVFRRFNIKHLVFDGVEVNLVMHSDGTTSLDKLFQPKRVAAANTERPVVPEKTPKSTTEKKPQKEPSTFKAGELPMAIAAGKAEVRNSKVTVDIEKSDARIVLKDAGFGFSGIDIDPENLGSHNRADFQFSGQIEIGGKEKKEKVFEAEISGAGETRPFDPSRATWEPNWTSSVTVAKGAKMDTVPIIEKIREALAAINKPGIDLSNLLVSGELVQDATTELSYKRGRYHFEKPFLLDFADAEFSVAAGSWLDAASNQHQVRGVLTASALFTEEIQKKAETFVAEKSNGKVPPKLVRALFAPIIEDGRIQLDVVSKGDLNRPMADIETPLGNFGDLLKKSGSTLEDVIGIGKGLLEGLLNRKK